MPIAELVHLTRRDPFQRVQPDRLERREPRLSVRARSLQDEALVHERAE